MRRVIPILFVMLLFISLNANEDGIVERYLGTQAGRLPLKITYSASLIENDNDLEYEVIIDIKFEYLKDHPSYVGDEEIKIIFPTSELPGSDIRPIPLGPHEFTLDDDRTEFSTQLKYIYSKTRRPGFGFELKASQRFLMGGRSYPDFWDELLKDTPGHEFFSFPLHIPGLIIQEEGSIEYRLELKQSD